MLNRVVLIGRLTRDPELRYSANGVAIVNFTLAVDRRFKNAQGEKETDFINCKAFKALAELIANYLSKGKMAAVSGSLQISNYTKDGQKRTSADVIADDVQFLSPREHTEASNGGAEKPYARSASLGTEVPPDDDIPF